MVLQEEEKQDLDLICSVCMKDKTTVQEVLRAILQAATIKTYSGANELVIPYVCKLSLEYNDKITPKGVITEVRLKADPMKGLIQEISAISEGEDPPSKKKFKQDFSDAFNTILDRG